MSWRAGLPGLRSRGDASRPDKDVSGEIDVPVAINGMVVAPGDLVLGEDDGLLCVPFGAMEAVHAAAVARQEAEVKQMEAIEEGRSAAPWPDETLRRLGCEGLD
jgi:regulator of RNase E activity RraA